VVAGVRELLVLVVLALAGLLALAAPAAAHATLLSTEPTDGAELEQAPDAVTMTFNEPVAVPAGGIRVYDGDGERVDTGDPRNLEQNVVGVGLRPGLGDDSYIVTWRVVSADGHPLKGAFLFAVGDAAEADEELLARLFSDEGGRLAGLVGVLVRTAAYAGTLLFAGAVVFARIPARHDTPARTEAARWARRGALVGLVAAVLAVPVQAVATTGLGPAQALAPPVLADTLASSVGMSALVRLVALAAGLALVTRRPHTSVVLALAGVATLSFLLDGHTRTVDPAWLMVVGDTVHLLAAAVWFGGLVVLGDTLRRRAFDDDPSGAARLVAAFSSLAAIALAAVVLGGLAMSLPLVRAPRALTSTSYGWTLLVKLGLAAAVVALGAVNNRRLVPAVVRATHPVPSGGSAAHPAAEVRRAPDPRAGWRRLRRTVRGEVALLLAVLLVTGSLVNLRPAAEEAGITGILDVYEPVSDDLDLNLVVDPNRAGFNEIHLYLLNETGRPASAVDDVTLELSLPEEGIGPLVREPLVAGPGHWVLAGRELAIPGRWQIDVVVRVDRFTERTVSVPVVVNP
jgi:copper transport protein